MTRTRTRHNAGGGEGGGALFGCSDGNVHALTQVRTCSTTSSYIISVNVMTIFHGFVCRRVASTMKHKHRLMRHNVLFYVYVSAMYGLLSCCPIIITVVEGGNWALSSSSNVVVSLPCLLIRRHCSCRRCLHHCCCCRRR